MNAGQIIGQTLKLYDIEYFFAFTGGDQDIWLGLRDAGIKYILPHNERCGVAMADTYSRLTGKPSFTYGQWGPGAAIAVGGMADAYWAKSPVICITSATNTRSLYKYAYQGIDDQQGLFDSIIKWNAYVSNISRLPDILRTAIRTAVSGVPGPVHIDIPCELTFFTQADLPDAEAQLYAEPMFKKFPAFRVAPPAEDIEKAIQVIGQAQKPLILAGGGVITSEAWDELVQFAEALSIPVLTSMAGKAAIESDHPLAVGVPGNYSRKVANEVVAECDTYVVIGSNLGDMPTQAWRLPRPSAKIVHIDLDPSVLGTSFKEEVSIMADAKPALQALQEAAAAAGLTKSCPWADWTREVQARVASWKAAFAELAGNTGAPGAINPYSVIAALNKVTAPEDLVVVDTGYMGAFGGALVDIKERGRKFVRTAGSLGWAFPASLGAQIAIKDKGRVFCVTGDGGFGYHPSELETALRYGLPVVAVVLNNSMLAFEYHIQKFTYKDVVPAVNDFLDIDYAAVAQAFGAYGEKVTEAGALEGALRRALDSGKPAVLDVRVDKEIHAPVTYYEAIVERRV